MIFRTLLLLIASVIYSIFSCFSVEAKSNIHSQLPEKFTFQNFSHQVVLQKYNTSYQIAGKEKKFQLSNRLLIKTIKGVTTNKISQLTSIIDKVSELFIGQSFNYFLVELDQPENIVSAYKLLKNQKDILLVQPDILQIKTSPLEKQNQNSGSINKVIDETLLLAAQKRRKARIQDNKNIINAHKGVTKQVYPGWSKIKKLWLESKGKGVSIAIIDDGINLEHPELKHIEPLFSYDSQKQKLTAMPDSILDNHGTRVAGIIFAAHNDKDIDGIAPNAELIALRQPDSWLSSTLVSFQLAKLAGAVIINCSWNTGMLLQPVSDVVNDLAKHGRDGKGVAVIFSAGNQGIKIKSHSTEASINSAIVVAAHNKDFKLLASSNFGPFVDVIAYGGNVQSTLVSGELGVFSGTSLAAAITSGVAALLLSKDPEMTLTQLNRELKLFFIHKTP